MQTTSINASSRRSGYPGAVTTKQSAIEALRDIDDDALSFLIALNLGASTYRTELRLMDGLLDALETFWRSAGIKLNVVCPPGQADAIGADLIRVPRLDLRILSEPEVLAAADVSGEGLTGVAYQTLLTLAAASSLGAPAVLTLSTDTFPLRPFSATALIDACADIADVARGAAVGGGARWRPLGLFSAELATSALQQLLHEGLAPATSEIPAHSASAAGRMASKVLIAGSNAELGFWSQGAIDYTEPPLMREVIAMQWMRNGSAPWVPQPWKTSSEPYFSRVLGAPQADPELVLPRLYGTFDR